jgi:site-specific DNA-methyltransferase (adenine-specific)
MKKMVTSKLCRPDNFYRQPCWLDIWRHTCSDRQLTFWSRMNERNASVLISYLEADGFLTRLEDCSPAKLQVHSTYYSQLKSYRVKLKGRIPSMNNVQMLNTPYFLTSLQKIWMSMRILRTLLKHLFYVLTASSTI